MNKENWNQNQRIQNNYSLTVRCCVISVCGESEKIHHYFQNLEKLGDTHRRIYNEKKTTQKDTTREHVARQSVSKLTLKIPPILLNTIKLVILLTWLEEIEHMSIGHQHILFTNQKCAPYPERRTTWVERGIFVVTGMILWVERYTLKTSTRSCSNRWSFLWQWPQQSTVWKRSGRSWCVWGQLTMPNWSGQWQSQLKR